MAQAGITVMLADLCLWHFRAQGVLPDMLMSSIAEDAPRLTGHLG